MIPGRHDLGDRGDTVGDECTGHGDGLLGPAGPVRLGVEQQVRRSRGADVIDRRGILAQSGFGPEHRGIRAVVRIDAVDAREPDDPGHVGAVQSVIGQESRVVGHQRGKVRPGVVTHQEEPLRREPPRVQVCPHEGHGAGGVLGVCRMDDPCSRAIAQTVVGHRHADSAGGQGAADVAVERALVLVAARPVAAVEEDDDGKDAVTDGQIEVQTMPHGVRPGPQVVR